MRGLILLAFLALPAMAQDSGYDPGVLAGCLDAAPDQAAKHACIGKGSRACMDAPDGQTTVGMGMCLRAETADWDARLNEAYGLAMKDATEGDASVAEYDSAAEPVAPILRQAQRNWIGYRDQSCIYESKRFYGGSAGGPAAGQCMLELTAAQALRLQVVARGWGEN